MRVLIPTVTAGAGHLQAAGALEEAWRALRPDDEVRRVDVLDYTPRWYRKIYVKGYLKLIEHAPDLYAMVFKKTDTPSTDHTIGWEGYFVIMPSWRSSSSVRMNRRSRATRRAKIHISPATMTIAPIR